MFNEGQIELLKSMWEQARVSAQQSHEAFRLVMSSQKTFIDSMRGAGEPFSVAADHYQKLIDFHSQQYKAALEFLDYSSKEYHRALEQLKATGKK